MDFSRHTQSKPRGGGGAGEGKGTPGIVESTLAVIAGAGITFPLEYMRTQAVFPQKVSPMTSREVLTSCWRRGMIQHVCKLVLVQQVCWTFGEASRSNYLQGLSYPGFWRRMMAEETPILIGFLLGGFLELSKQQLILGSEPLWKKTVLKSPMFSKLNMFNSIVLTSVFMTERAATEQLRKINYKMKEDSNYLEFDKNSISNKLITIPVASLMTYPLELLRLVTNQLYLEHPEWKPKVKTRVLETYNMFKAVGWNGASRGLFPYIMSNLIFISVFTWAIPIARETN